LAFINDRLAYAARGRRPVSGAIRINGSPITKIIEMMKIAEG